MYTLAIVDIPELLNKKYLEWQYRTGMRKTLDDFAEYLGIKRPLLSMWMNGTRKPGNENKKRLIELFGNDALEAFGEDPKLYYIQQNWHEADEELQRSLYEQMQNNLTTNELQRTQKRRKVKNAH